MYDPQRFIMSGHEACAPQPCRTEYCPEVSIRGKPYVVLCRAGGRGRLHTLNITHSTTGVLPPFRPRAAWMSLVTLLSRLFVAYPAAPEGEEVCIHLTGGWHTADGIPTPKEHKYGDVFLGTAVETLAGRH